MEKNYDVKGVARGFAGPSATLTKTKLRYCLYARKSTESEERQVLSVDSQVKEMLTVAEREGLDVNELGLRHKLDDEIARFNKSQGHVIQVIGATKTVTADLDVRAYAKYMLREGSVSEKRELLGEFTK